MRKFNVGDILRIRQWEDMIQEFGVDEDGHIPCDLVFTKRMINLCGRTFTVEEIDGDRYFSEEGVEDMWSISGDMLEYFDAEYDNDDSIILNESDVLQILTQK